MAEETPNKEEITVSKEISNDSLKNSLIVAFISAFFVFLSVFFGYLFTRLSSLEDVIRTHEGRIAGLEKCVDCGRGPRTRTINGIEVSEYEKDDKTKDGAVISSIEVQVLSKEYRWACGASSKDDALDDQNEKKINLEELIKKYDPKNELKNAKKIVVVGTASYEGGLSDQEDLAKARASTLTVLVAKNLQKDIPVIGMSFGKYISDKDQTDCKTNDTSGQRRILIVKITYQAPDLSDSELEMSLKRQFVKLVENDDFPVDIRKYSNFQNNKQMFIKD